MHFQVIAVLYSLISTEVYVVAKIPLAKCISGCEVISKKVLTLGTENVAASNSTEDVIAIQRFREICFRKQDIVLVGLILPQGTNTLPVAYTSKQSWHVNVEVDVTEVVGCVNFNIQCRGLTTVLNHDSDSIIVRTVCEISNTNPSTGLSFGGQSLSASREIGNDDRERSNNQQSAAENHLPERIIVGPSTHVIEALLLIALILFVAWSLHWDINNFMWYNSIRDAPWFYPELISSCRYKICIIFCSPRRQILLILILHAYLFYLVGWGW